MAEQVISTEAVGGSSSSAIELYASFPFDNNEEFQQGLKSLIENGAFKGLTEEDSLESLRRAKVFYFNRTTGSNVSLEEVRNHDSSSVSSASTADSTSPSTSDDSRVLTFAELQELIQSGKVDQIPNNKIIPDGLNETPPSQSAAPARRKPWEVVTEPYPTV